MILIKKIAVICLIGLSLQCASVDIADKIVRIETPMFKTMILRNCLQEIIAQTGVSVILIGGTQNDDNHLNISDLKIDMTLSELCNRLAGNEYSWKIIGNTLIFQKNGFAMPSALSLPMRPDFLFQNNNPSRPLLEALFNGKLAIVSIACTLNNPKYIENEIFFDYWLRVVDQTNTLTLIYRFDPEDGNIIYSHYQKEFPRVNDFSPSLLLGLAVSQRVEARHIYMGEDIADGNALLSCQLILLESKEFKVIIKNISTQKLTFQDFRQKGLVINDLASFGRYFEVDEIGSYYIYPPLESEVPQDLTLAPGEEKVFIFPLAGCRSRKSSARKSIWEIGAEKKYDYRPDNKCEILTRQNRNYNLFGIVVYFKNEKGIGCKAFNKEFIDGSGYFEPLR